MSIPSFPGSGLYPDSSVYPGFFGTVAPVTCQRIDSGSMAAVQINGALINDRTNVGVVPSWAACRQVMDDAENPGQYLLCGWLPLLPVFAAHG